MVTTIRELAQLAKVSETTISLAFQKSSRISEKTRKRIASLAKQVGYVPNQAARRLRNGKSRARVLGVVVPDITNPFFAYVVQAVEKVATRRGYGVFIADSQWQAEKEVKEIRALIENRADGVLACLCQKSREGLDWLDRFALPYLLIDTCPQEYAGPYVANDVAEAGRMGAAHLADVGCRNIAFVTADAENADFSSFREMQSAFELFFRDRECVFSSRNVFHCGLTIDAGQKAYDQIVGAMPQVDGLFCVNSLCALGLLDAARRAGRTIAVMGVDDLDVCSLSSISLTTIRQPYEQLARIAAEMLVAAIDEGERPSVKMTLKPELIVRQSTQCVSAAKG